MYQLHFSEILNELASRPGSIEEFAKAYKEFRAELERTLLEERYHLKGIENRKGSQSRQFMIDMLPHIQKYMRQFPRGRSFSILDVGPGTGYGSELLGSMYATSELGYTAKVTTTDISKGYYRYMRAFAPHVHPMSRNVFNVEDTFDIVIASHVIEHVPDWKPFVRRLKQLSKGIVILCGPYKENPEHLTSGHVNIVDEEFVGQFGAFEVALVNSPGWGQFMDPRYEMFIAKIKGEAVSAQA